VQPWRCNIGGTYSLIDIKDIPDPAWQVQVVLELTKKGSNFRPRLIVCNSISLVFGIAANIATLLMRSDISFPLSRYLLQLVFATIACGYIAALILIALVVSAFKELQEPSPVEHAFTEAYFYAIEAAALYFLTSSFVIYTAYMIWNSHRTRDDLANQFGGGHLSLKILTIIFMAYILIGAKIFSHIEGWRYLDGVFWADVTILTVGFGDFKPMTHLGRALLFPYAAFGIFFLFLILYCVTQVVFERGGSLWEARIRDQQRRREVQRRKTNGRPRTLKSTTPEIQPPLPTFYNPRTTKKTHLLPAGQQTSNNSSSDGEKISKKWKHEARERRREEFEKMQEIALRATSRRIFLSIGLWLLFSIFLWMGGAVLFYLSEHHQGWTYFNAVYFTFISLLTIGYGDNNLISMPGKAIFVLWSLIVIPSLTMLISTGTELVGMPYLTRTKKWIREKLSQNKIERGTKPKARLSSTYKSQVPVSVLEWN
jgi:potassium channel subfamily K